MTPDEKRAEIVSAIRLGIVDVATVHAALREVLESEAARVEWSVDLEQLGLGVPGVLTANSMTLAESVDVMDELGIGWDAINPILDAKQAVSILTAVVVHRSDQSADDARGRVGSLTQQQLADAWSLVEQRPPDPT